MQAQHPLSWRRKFSPHLPESPARPFEGTSGGPEVIVGARTCLPVVTMGVAWMVEGYRPPTSWAHAG